MHQIAAATSIEREKDAVEEDAREAKRQLENARSLEKELRQAIKSEHHMWVSIIYTRVEHEATYQEWVEGVSIDRLHWT